MAFRVGQKVVCVDAHDIEVVTGLVLGATYTVHGIAPTDGYGTHGIFLCEVLPPEPLSGGLYGFRASRFRPAVERKTDISIFTEMLTTERADA